MNVRLVQYIQSARIHHATLREVLPMISPGVTLQTIVAEIERKIVEKGGLQAFPVGLAVNHCVAHYTPDPMGPPIPLKDGDLLKIDFGTHVGGAICDAALTVGVGERGRTLHQEIIDISKKATQLGVKMSGVDVFLKEIGAEIEEYVMSKVVTYEGKEYPLSTLRDLCGHSIGPYQVHAGKAVPNTRIDFTYDAKMLEDEVYAIEPFVTTGPGMSIPDHRPEVLSHYAISTNPIPKTTSRAGLFYTIYQGLPFSKYWSTTQSYLAELQMLEEKERASPSRYHLLMYPPLYEVEGSYVAHHEENVYITAHRPIPITSTCLF